MKRLRSDLNDSVNYEGIFGESISTSGRGNSIGHGADGTVSSAIDNEKASTGLGDDRGEGRGGDAVDELHPTKRHRSKIGDRPVENGAMMDGGVGLTEGVISALNEVELREQLTRQSREVAKLAEEMESLRQRLQVAEANRPGQVSYLVV